MNYILNFDVFFAILLVGMIFCSLFKKSHKYSNNFLLFLITTTILGCLVYFKVDEMVLSKIGGSLAPLFTKLSSILNRPTYFGLFYFVILLFLDLVLFLIIKLIVQLFTNDRRKFKKDMTYTPKHNAFLSFFVSLLKFVLVAHIILVIFVYFNIHMGFDVSNSYVIKYFNLYEKPLLDFLQAKGTAFFKAVGY